MNERDRPPPDIELLHELVRAGTEDWLDTTQIEAFFLGRGVEDLQLRRLGAIGLVSIAIRDGLIWPGEVHGAFKPWSGPVEQVITRVVEAWSSLTRPSESPSRASASPEARSGR